MPIDLHFHPGGAITFSGLSSRIDPVRPVTRQDIIQKGEHTIISTTDLAYLVENENGISFWIPKKWRREDGTLSAPARLAEKKARAKLDAPLAQSLPAGKTIHDLGMSTQAAIDFLQDWCPGGPWTLTAIIPDGWTVTRTFTADDTATLRRWIDTRQGRFNIFFTVNPVHGPLHKKARKVDIAAMSAVHVDLDPSPGISLTRERRRIRNQLHAFSPAPTVVLDSGNGYQAFWLLNAPVKNDGREETITGFENINREMALRLGGDACHNIDRIMRLPGTINIPTKTKREAGRYASCAKLLSADWGVKYDLSDLS